jgi:CO dehydrogenase maturation factor
VEGGGTGCACPENVFLRNLLTHIILKRDEFVIVDLEAGIEHLGRATAQGVDMMVIVVEPASQSISVAHQIIKMATEIGVKNIRIVGNKIYNPEEFSFIKSKFMNNSLSGYIPYSDLIRSVDVQGSSLYENLDTELLNHFKTIYKNILVSV